MTTFSDKDPRRHRPGPCLTRERLLELGLVVAGDSAPTEPASPPFLADADRGVSPPPTMAGLVAVSPSPRAAVVGSGGPTARPVSRPPCSSCGSTDWARSRVRRGQLLCVDCARGDR
jgi:hypothetical protein